MRKFKDARFSLPLLFAAFLFCPSLSAQISPGPLAAPHQSLDGGSQCVKCHEVNTHSPSFKCEECHTEIARELQTNRGLHATFPRSGPPGAGCVKCHSDHNGVGFNMIHWTPTAQGFDHSKTGFVLDGKHSSTECRACHTFKNISPAERASLSAKNLNRTWMGLTPACATCHEDKHQGRLGTQCQSCHNTTDWKQTSTHPETFDHSKTRYPLTGAHISVDCLKCHKAGDDGRPRYFGLFFSSCADCHGDPHKGTLAGRCESCHTTTTWKRTEVSEHFDHSTTKFQLLGKHAGVGCMECHKSADFKKPVAFAQCLDCHADAHSGQFAARLDKGRCESCHTVQGWSPSTFTINDHAKTKYPIAFPHEKVTCAQCHIPAGKKTRFKVAFARCVDCHADEHQGQFAAAPWQNDCKKCHAGATFKTASYTLTQHQKSPFPLTGGHMAVACNECHKPMNGLTTAVYHFKNAACATCHEDPHRGQFAALMVGGPGAKRSGCETCHNTGDWHDISRFNHSATKFTLIGAHRAVACIDCHKPPNLETTLLHVRYEEAPLACSECHRNPHADQFGERKDNCAQCHNSSQWKPSTFNHEETRFSLTGGHENVRCSACHTLKREVNGGEVLFYKPTPRQCSDCHGASIPAPQMKKTS